MSSMQQGQSDEDIKCNIRILSVDSARDSSSNAEMPQGRSRRATAFLATIDT